VTGTDGSRAGSLTLETGETRRPFDAEALRIMWEAYEGARIASGDRVVLAAFGAAFHWAAAAVQF
jgi:3-oxoacyl-[acyl-carrier-protein] synthase III